METLEISTLTLVLLMGAALLAGFIDTLVGGGGLITIPALLAAGVPPIFALGTNKLQAVVGSGTASMTMFLRKKISFGEVRSLMLLAFLGSLFGSVVVQFFDTAALNIAIPVVIVVIAGYFLIAPTHALRSRAPRVSRSVYHVTAVPGIGFYDGMFGPGTGSFLALAGVSLRGQNLVYATVVAKPLNFATNVASLLVFVWFAKVLWLVGVSMMIGQFIGASLGARALFRINPVVLRYLVIAVCFVMLLSWGFRELKPF